MFTSWKSYILVFLFLNALGPIVPTRVNFNPLLSLGFLYFPEFSLARIGHMIKITQG